MLLDHCYCPYICTILKYVHHFANIAKKYAKWENYTSVALRGWSPLNREQLENVLYNENNFSKNEVQVINANLGLFMIG